jgi:hypothetical protein
MVRARKQYEYDYKKGDLKGARASTEGVKTNKTMDDELKRLGLTKKDFKDMKLPDPNPFRTKV